MCCSNQIWPFGTTKSVTSSKIYFFLFFKLLILFPTSNLLILFRPPLGGNAPLYTRLLSSNLDLDFWAEIRASCWHLGLRFGHQICDLGIKSVVWASRLGVGTKGWDLSLNPGIRASRLILIEANTIFFLQNP